MNQMSEFIGPLKEKVKIENHKKNEFNERQ